MRMSSVTPHKYLRTPRLGTTSLDNKHVKVIPINVNIFIHSSSVTTLMVVVVVDLEPLPGTTYGLPVHHKAGLPVHHITQARG